MKSVPSENEIRRDILRDLIEFLEGDTRCLVPDASWTREQQHAFVAKHDRATSRIVHMLQREIAKPK